MSSFIQLHCKRFCRDVIIVNPPSYSIAAGWRGVVSKNQGFRISPAGVRNLNLPIANRTAFMSLSFPTCQIKVEREVLGVPPHKASSRSGHRCSVFFNTQVMKRSPQARRERRHLCTPSRFSSCQHPVTGSRPRLLSGGIKHHTQDPRSQTYHLGWARAFLEVLGWIAYCCPSLCLPGLPKMLEAYGTGDTHSKSATRRPLWVKNDPV